ncbi:MAG: 3-deoxy-manno-octulosonate cytidylyltransferase [Halobacteriovoraceae bacterium]|nr:3-deoxy-manno-octulosonate cytidylyltransferase [Halobacteriovoraceae bacterium]|tara:strand:- start:17548 stop:18288 length:741 start_codon:yes stop_codon:yes gene_type:complete
MSKTLILIPARYGSSRFPGKPLAKINNKPMIQHVVENCQASGFDYAVVTDNDEIEAALKDNYQVVRVDDDVTTGSERIALALSRHFSEKNYEYVINVQGDEPLLKAELLKELNDFHTKNEFDICTAVKRRSSSDEEYSNPNVVKCLLSEKDGKCLYFSRASIPFFRDGQVGDWHQHIGLYSYKTKALESFVSLEESRLEKAEKLEQLRALENGMSIGAIETNAQLIGVDTPEDIHKIEGVLSGKKR